MFKPVFKPQIKPFFKPFFKGRGISLGIPATIPGLKYWYDAKLISNVVLETPFEFDHRKQLSWKNSTPGLDLPTAIATSMVNTAGIKPRYDAGRLNTLSGVEFLNSQFQLQTPTAITQPFTASFIYEPKNHNESYNVISDNLSSGNGILYQEDGDALCNINGPGIFIGELEPGPSYVRLFANGASSSIKITNMLTGTTISQSGDIGAGSLTTLAFKDTISAMDEYQLFIFEYIHYTRILTAPEDTSIENYLQSKWFITTFPLKFRDVVGYWDSSDSSSISVSVLGVPRVTKRNDLSGNQKHQLQNTLVDSPEYEMGTQNSLNSVRYKSSGEFLSMEMGPTTGLGLLLDQPYTFVMNIKINDLNSVLQRIFDSPDPTGFVVPPGTPGDINFMDNRNTFGPPTMELIDVDDFHPTPGLSFNILRTNVVGNLLSQISTPATTFLALLDVTSTADFAQIGSTTPNIDGGSIVVPPFQPGKVWEKGSQASTLQYNSASLSFSVNPNRMYIRFDCRIEQGTTPNYGFQEIFRLQKALFQVQNFVQFFIGSAGTYGFQVLPNGVSAIYIVQGPLNNGPLPFDTNIVIELVIDSVLGIYKVFISNQSTGSMEEQLAPPAVNTPGVRISDSTIQLVTSPGIVDADINPGRSFLSNIFSSNGIPPGAYVNHPIPPTPVQTGAGTFEDRTEGMFFSLPGIIGNPTAFSHISSANARMRIDGKWTDNGVNQLPSDGSFAQASTGATWASSFSGGFFVPTDPNNIPIDIIFGDGEVGSFFTSATITYNATPPANELEISTDGGTTTGAFDISDARTTLIIIYDGNTTKVHQDGSLLATIDGGVGILRNFGIGGSYQGTLPSDFNDNESFIVAREMNASEIAETFSELGTKWGN